MIMQFMKTWIKKVSKKIVELIKFKEWNWKNFLSMVAQETVLTAVTVAVTVFTMGMLGAGVAAA